MLLEKSKLISGTTWHTAGLLWHLRGICDIETELLKTSRLLYSSLQEETGINPGWINNGGLCIAHTLVSINISTLFICLYLFISENKYPVFCRSE